MQPCVACGPDPNAGPVRVSAVEAGRRTAVGATLSLVNGVLLSPLPFRDPSQLVTVQVHIRSP